MFCAFCTPGNYLSLIFLANCVTVIILQKCFKTRKQIRSFQLSLGMQVCHLLLCSCVLNIQKLLCTLLKRSFDWRYWVSSFQILQRKNWTFSLPAGFKQWPHGDEQIFLFTFPRFAWFPKWITAASGSHWKARSHAGLWARDQIPVTSNVKDTRNFILNQCSWPCYCMSKPPEMLSMVKKKKTQKHTLKCRWAAKTRIKCMFYMCKRK